jgi:ATP-dependent 26S proteasome regulatory subunit
MALDSFFHNKIESLKLEIIQGQAVLRRLEAQRNDYNSRVRLLREELGLLQQPGSYVGEVVKVMGTKKVLVKVHPEGKYGTTAHLQLSSDMTLIIAQLSILQTVSMLRSLPWANECLCSRIRTSSKRCYLHLLIHSYP